MTTSEQQSSGGGSGQGHLFTLSPAASPASRSRARAVGVVLPMSGGAGPGSSVSFAQYDPTTRSWRTSQTSLEIGTPFGWLLGDLAAAGFDAEWGVLPACAVGAPHVRERLFLVAYPNGLHGKAGLGAGSWGPLFGVDGDPSPWPDPVDALMETARRSRRVADGIPDPLEPARVKALGNAVVPQVAEHIGRLIVAADQSANPPVIPLRSA